ncbi:MAG TPA: septum formation initiator family protein [bacterium]|nr:septum formation initiator family protein [bacterium]
MATVRYRPPTIDVARRPKRRRRFYVWAVVAISGLLLLAFLYLWQYVSILELNYEVARVKRELDEAYQEKVTLKADLYRRRSMAEIDEVAHEKLGLQPPAPGQVIIVEDGS